MDWKLLMVTFGTVFLAEVGDKTQLATLAFAGESKKPWIVFAGASLALVAAAAVGTVAGALLAKWIPGSWMRRGAAVLFIAIGVVYLLLSFRKSEG